MEMGNGGGRGVGSWEDCAVGVSEDGREGDGEGNARIGEAFEEVVRSDESALDAQRVHADLMLWVQEDQIRVLYHPVRPLNASFHVRGARQNRR